MLRTHLIAGAACAALLASATAADPVGEGGVLRDAGLAIPPGGWLEYCERTSRDPSCRGSVKPRTVAQPVVLDEAHWKQVEAIQIELSKIEQIPESGRDDRWVIAGKNGDCEDIALAGRQKLLAAGIPRAAVRIATGWTENGDYHAMVSLDAIRDGKRETYILDNRSTQVMSWEALTKTGYRFLMRQASTGPAWVSIAAPDGRRLS